MKKILILLFVVMSIISVSAGITQKNLSLDEAFKISEEAIKEARRQKVNVSVVILDRSGNVLVSVKDDNAGLHTVDTAKRKAFTALTFKTTSAEFGKRASNFAALKEITDTITLPGGIVIKDKDEVIGAIGIGGAPSGQTDENIAVSAVLKTIK